MFDEKPQVYIPSSTTTPVVQSWSLCSLTRNPCQVAYQGAEAQDWTAAPGIVISALID